MIVTVKTERGSYLIDRDKFVDISIPMRFDGLQPNAFGVEAASSTACESGDLIGDTRRGGSCNFERVTLIPHCNGTHTECVGHITNDRISVRGCLRDAFSTARVVSIMPAPSTETKETYASQFAENDWLITASAVENALEPGTITVGSALVVRTLPNDDSKLSRAYNAEQIPPYFTTEAMNLIVERGFKHLLVDLPSIDRLFDEGRLSNHRIFWNVEAGKFESNATTRVNSTITELIYVRNEVEDGEYLLNLQIAPFESDASPSRPLLFPKTK
jgi:kynurenine formamidase